MSAPPLSDVFPPSSSWQSFPLPPEYSALVNLSYLQPSNLSASRQARFQAFLREYNIQNPTDQQKMEFIRCDVVRLCQEHQRAQRLSSSSAPPRLFSSDQIRSVGAVLRAASSSANSDFSHQIVPTAQRFMLQLKVAGLRNSSHALKIRSGLTSGAWQQEIQQKNAINMTEYIKTASERSAELRIRGHSSLLESTEFPVASAPGALESQKSQRTTIPSTTHEQQEGEKNKKRSASERDREGGASSDVWHVDLPLLNEKCRQIAEENQCAVEGPAVSEFLATAVQQFIKEIIENCRISKQRRCSDDSSAFPLRILAEPAKQLKKLENQRKRKNRQAAEELAGENKNKQEKRTNEEETEEGEEDEHLMPWNDPDGPLNLADLLSALARQPRHRASPRLYELKLLQQQKLDSWPSKFLPEGKQKLKQ